MTESAETMPADMVRTLSPGTAGFQPAFCYLEERQQSRQDDHCLQLEALLSEQWRSRGYLPHWEAGEVPQSITFRLADSMPTNVLATLRAELPLLRDGKADADRRMKIERALDRGHGEALLAHATIGVVVENALLHFDDERYKLHSWVIMPNHVHVVATPQTDWSLAIIVHSWKSFTATKANGVLGRSGTFWAREYYDRAVRDEVHYANAVSYVEMNPVKARLCTAPEEWRFSSAWAGRS